MDENAKPKTYADGIRRGIEIADDHGYGTFTGGVGMDEARKVAEAEIAALAPATVYAAETHPSASRDGVERALQARVRPSTPAAIVADMKRQEAARESVVTSHGEEVAVKYDGVIGKIRGFKVGQEIEWHDPAMLHPRRGRLTGSDLYGNMLVAPYGQEPGAMGVPVAVSIVNVMTFPSR